ncbi:MAG TPA: methyltransferase domain-containing protein [Candidatus Paceibacterota bacterium]|nr:methyltransferase domain-containing protein [Candidatus Paceibacterota bacterium]
MINLGCGGRFHPDWVNADIAPRDPSVLRCDLSQRLPFPDNVFDAVYHSNVLEHIRRDDALPFMRECLRVLKPGGILRVAVPDLERICKLYLEKLSCAVAGDAASAHDYEWMLLEMYDQTVREKNGGAMLDFLRQNPLPNEPFVLDRIGQEGRELIAALSNLPPSKQRTQLREIIRRPRALFEMLGQGFLKKFFGANAPRALDIGRFRLSGEVHQWMYDRFSLARLMLAAGFRGPALRSPVDSAIPGWTKFNLDTLPDGSIVKPDSFFMEATKPG